MAASKNRPKNTSNGSVSSAPSLPAEEQKGSNLLALGTGGGSKVERLKVDSRHLRGQITEELAQDTSHFTEEQTQLLKFHGTYQQENRDARAAARASGGAKAHQLMVRSRIPGGVLTAAQYLAEDDLAGRYGNGTLRITTRQGFQLHGVLKGDLRATIKGINDALLSTLAACGDVNRNVIACPAPLPGRVNAQLAALAHQIALYFAPRSSAYHEIWLDGEQVDAIEAPENADAEPIYGPSYLPRKFKIGIAFPGDNCVDVYANDVGLVPELDGDRLTGFTVLVGGGMGATHGKTETYPRLATPLGFVPSDDLLAAIEAIMTLQRDYGDRQNRKHARMKYVVEERGIAWFRAETERRLGHPLADPHSLTWEGTDDHLGWHQQPDGKWFLGLHVLNGRIADTPRARLRSGLRAAVKRFQPGVHLTTLQNVLFTDLTASQRAPLEKLLARYGIAADPESIGVARDALACPALPTCGLALAEAERALPAVVDQIQADLNDLGLDGERISIRMTGCPNGCARPYMGDIGIVGRSKDLYNISVGGDWSSTRMNELYAASVRLDEIAATIRPLLVLWRDGRAPGEAIGDFCARTGIATLRAHVAEQPAPAAVPAIVAAEPVAS